MIRTLLAATTLVAAAPVQPASPFTRILECELSLADAARATDTLEVRRARDDSSDDAVEQTFQYDPQGTTILGVAALSVGRSNYVSPKQVEYSFAAAVGTSFDDLSARLLRRYGRTHCESKKSPRGVRVCLLHLRTDTGPEGFDVDIQTSEFAGRAQIECLYGDLPH